MLFNQQASNAFAIKANTYTKISILVSIFIIIFATSPDIFLYQKDDRNLLLIGIMALAPIVLLFSKKMYHLDIWLLFFFLSIVFSPALNHPDTLRWSTIIYTTMFGITFIAYEHLLKRNLFSVDQYLKLLKNLLLAYFAVLLIQQFCVLTGLPVFMAGNYRPEEPWKLSSLAAEPSHAALSITILMYSFITIKELVLNRKYKIFSDWKNDKWIWVSFLWYMLTSHSASALLLLLIFFSQFMTFRNFLYLVILGTISVFALSFLELPVFERASKFFTALLTLDPKQIIAADHSGSYRFVPALLIFQKADLTSIDGWFGHGIDYVGSFLYLVMPGTIKGYATGGIMILWLEYGFLSFILLIIFSFLAIYRPKKIMPVVLWFIFLFLGNGINTQIFWIGIILLFTNKYFYKHCDAKNYPIIPNNSLTAGGQH